MPVATRKFIPPDELESKAIDLLNRHDLWSIPVNPVIVARAEGIEVFSIDFSDDSVSGILRKEDDAFRIYVNSAHSTSRKRFTIAHELGHYVLHRDGVTAFVDPELNLYRSDSSQGDMEVQANIFAAALLMPAELVKHYYRNYREIRAMAGLFSVSLAAMGHRIASLGL